MHNRSDLYCEPRATEEPRAGLKQGHLNSQSEGLNSGKFHDKIMLMRYPGEVHKTTMDEF